MLYQLKIYLNKKSTNQRYIEHNCKLYYETIELVVFLKSMYLDMYFFFKQILKLKWV